jgi:hypothetical protein
MTAGPSVCPVIKVSHIRVGIFVPANHRGMKDPRRSTAAADDTEQS